jgi:hypothetical protein
MTTSLTRARAALRTALRTALAAPKSARPSPSSTGRASSWRIRAGAASSETMNDLKRHAPSAARGACRHPRHGRDAVPSHSFRRREPRPRDVLQRAAHHVARKGRRRERRHEQHQRCHQALEVAPRDRALAAQGNHHGQ